MFMYSLDYFIKVMYDHIYLLLLALDNK